MHTIAATRERLQNPSAMLANGALNPGYFDRVKAGHQVLAETAWQHLAECHAQFEERCIFDDQFADTDTVYQTVLEICQSYNRLNSLDSVLASLYLNHRKRFLNNCQDFYLYEGQCFLGCPLTDEEECVVISAYGYFGCSGLDGDIVAFSAIDPDEIGFGWHRPVAELWAQLKLDSQMPLGIVNYDAVLDMVNLAVRDTLASESGPITQPKALQNLGKWVQDIELDPECPLPGIAVAAHAALLGAI